MHRRSVFSIIGSVALTACGLSLGDKLPDETATPAVPLQLIQRTNAPNLMHNVIEWDVIVQHSPADVYDTFGNNMWLTAMHQVTQKTLRVPLFWMAEYDTEINPTNVTGWRARISLPDAGIWRISASQGDIIGPAIDITVASNPDTRGMVRVHPRGFAFDDDTPFVPIGVNLGWSTAQGATILTDYERWFAQLAAHGGNAARVWMASWAFGIEWKDTPLGDYRNRMRHAWLLDQVFILAQRYGIRIMLCLMNHGAFSTTTNAEWHDNPYNQVNGGPLAQPEEFVTNPTAQMLWHKRVAYIGARYAAFSSLWCWEWWNEVDWTPIDDQPLAEWLIDTRALMQRVDPYQHPVTSSWSSVRMTELWQESALDVVQHHTYDADDVVRTINTARIPIKHILRQKPLLVSEIGLNAGGAVTADAIERVHLHNALWAPLMLGTAGSGMYWWWDTWLDPNHHWDAFAPLSTFVNGIDMRKMRSFSVSVAGAILLGLRNETTMYLWMRHAAYTAKEALRAYALAQTDDTNWQYVLDVQSWPAIVLDDVDIGAYVVEWFDPQHATWQPPVVVNSTSATLTLDIPDFAYDMAVKITRQR